ncbi:YcaO-like family protein [Natronomonas sp.]|uniref:YcaO-like family protein n=1 Tax=Natronomonas sp. TaxID=2184060 RepID=UPI002FC395BF
MTTVGFVGDGPAIEAISAALSDASAATTTVDPGAIAGADIAVVAAPVGDSAFQTAATAARGSGTPVVSVELGGIGGEPVAGVDAAVSGYAPGTACFDCLCGRIAATDPETDDGDCAVATARFAGALAGRELASLVAGGQSTLLGGVIEVPHAQRRVLPVPYCECGEDPSREAVPRERTERSLEESLSLAEGAFDARLGPITEVGEAESFPVPYYLATLASTPFSDADAPSHAAGVGADWDPAFMKALGEALERYSAAVYRTGELISEPSTPVAPERFVQPGDATAESAIEYWHPAEDLATGDPVELPAELVVFPPPERNVRPPITTGLGLGNDGIEALLSGLYEVIERDAAMLSWYSSYDPLGLAVDDEGFETLAARAESEGLDTTALLLTQDVDVPVVAVCVHREDEWPRFAAGMSADLDPEAAARGALEEAIQNWLELRRMGPDRAADESGAIGHYADLPEAARAFVSPETTVPADSVGPETAPDGAAELSAVVDRVADVGLDAYGARVTPRDVASLGFEAVRVVVPAAQPLFTGDAYFGERARSVPDSLGFEFQPERPMHPFP